MAWSPDETAVRRPDRQTQTLGARSRRWTPASLLPPAGQTCPRASGTPAIREALTGGIGPCPFQIEARWESSRFPSPRFDKLWLREHRPATARRDRRPKLFCWPPAPQRGSVSLRAAKDEGDTHTRSSVRP